MSATWPAPTDKKGSPVDTISSKLKIPALLVLLPGLLMTASDALEYGVEVPPGPLAVFIAVAMVVVGYFVPEGVLTDSARELFNKEFEEYAEALKRAPVNFDR